MLIVISRILRGPERPIDDRRQGQYPSAQQKRSSTSVQMLRSPIFWLLYAMFVCVSASGLMATAQLGPIAKDYRLSNTTITGRQHAQRGTGSGQRAERPGPAILRRTYRTGSGGSGQWRWHSPSGRKLLVTGGVRSEPWGFVAARVSSSLPGGRSFRYSPRPAPIRSDPDTRPRMSASSIPPREPRLSSCRLQTWQNQRPEAGTRFSSSRPLPT